ncbi:MAG TPA: hypothetical protein VK137_11495 [Planctomycetaceae bacterium]|nr:hypothetical protein [Planctomycetaceae bacterium]
MPRIQQGFWHAASDVKWLQNWDTPRSEITFRSAWAKVADLALGLHIINTEQQTQKTGRQESLSLKAVSGPVQKEC